MKTPVRKAQILTNTVLAAVLVHGAVAAHAQTTPAALLVGSVVVRRTASGERWRDSVVYRMGAQTQLVRTRIGVSGETLGREVVVVEDAREGRVERTSSRELLVVPRPEKTNGSTYRCGHAVTAVLTCTELPPEFVTVSGGQVRARRVLVTAEVRGAEPSFTEVWISGHGTVLRARARSSDTDGDIDTEALLPPGRLSEPVRSETAVRTAAITTRNASPSSRAFIEFGAAVGKRWVTVPATDDNGRDKGLGATASLGVFVNNHVAVVVAAEAYRTSARGDMLPDGWVTYPSDRFEQLVHVGAGLRLNAQRARGTFLRVTGGVTTLRLRRFGVANRQVVGTYDYNGRGASIAASLGHDIVAGHVVISPFVSTIHVMKVDVFTRRSHQLASPAMRNSVVQAGLIFGFR